MQINPDYLMYASTGLFILYLLPEIYANWKNRNANLPNLTKKMIIIVAGVFRISYGFATNNQPLIINYAPFLLLDGISLGMRCYYAYYYIAPIDEPPEIQI